MNFNIIHFLQLLFRSIVRFLIQWFETVEKIEYPPDFLANQYIDRNQPWVLAKEKINEKEVIKISSTGMNLFRILNICLEPIIPETAFKIRKYLNLNDDSFEHITISVKNHEIQSFKPLIERIEDEKIDNLIEASKSG